MSRAISHSESPSWIDFDDPPVARPRRPPRSSERARRQRHLRRLRRDLLVDLGAAVVLMIVVLSLTAGLGVVLLLELPVAGVIIASFALERRRRRRVRRR